MKGGGRHGHWREHNAVEYAHRTAGLVRGEYPYALIVDDYRKDDREHLYQWLMQVPEDVRIVSRSVGTPGQDKVLDLILGEKVGDRRLLLRVLAAGAEPSEARLVQTEAELESYEKHDRGNVTTCQRISLPLKSVHGHFVILLYPQCKGQPMPVTVWNRGRTQVTIAIGDQKDAVTFLTTEADRTAIGITRNGKDIVRMD
jgi:hypothetical protein